jgi:hypothetical protein
LNSVTYHWTSIDRSLRQKLETKVEDRKVYYRLLDNYQLIDLRNVTPPEVPAEEIALPTPEAELAPVEETVLPTEPEPVHDEETTLPPEPEPVPEPPEIEIIKTPVRQQEPAKEITKTPDEGLLAIGNTVVFDSEFRDPIRQQRIVRLQNISELNQMTREITKRFKRNPRALLIERDGRLHLDGEELESGPFMTDLWNTLLLGYLSKPFTPVEAHNRYGFASSKKNGELQRLLGKLHVKATELKFRNIIYYDQDQKSGMSLKPVIIVDRRQ